MALKDYLVKPHQDVHLSEFPTRVTGNGLTKEILKAKTEILIEEISQFQNRLFAEDRQSLLIIFQGMDSSGKDSVIKKIMCGVNPQGVVVTSFKHPSLQEMEHDFLWRISQKLPEHGQISVFNRSHYENVLISKVHPELVLGERLPDITHVKKIGPKFWKRRYEQINYFERNIRKNGTHILKFFLHLSKEEQRVRFLERIKNKEKHWKFSSSDIRERSFWKQYQEAYEKTFRHTSTKEAPWYIIPADDKPYAHFLIAKIIYEKMKSMDPVFPPNDKKERKMMKQAKRSLEKE